jgi:hypothetical protein
MCVRHFSLLYLSGLGLTHPNVIPKHIHALITCADELLGLHEPTLTRSEHESHDSKVGLSTVAFEVGNEFLG